MKIARISYEWPPPWLGLVGAPYGLTKAQAKLGHEITVFCARWPKAGPQEKLSGVKIFSIWRAPFSGLALITTIPLINLRFLVWRVFNKADVYHIHGHSGLYIYLLRYFFGFLDKTPIVAHFHICAKARKEEIRKANKPVKLVTKLIDWPLHILSDAVAVKVASKYLFVNEQVKDDVIKYCGADPKKCVVVESGVDADWFKKPMQSQKNELKQKLGFNTDDVVISNIGAFVERKNIHLIIESLSVLPKNFKLLLVGKGEGAYFEKIKSLISQLNLKERIVFTGEKSNKETVPYFQISDIFVLPSNYEGFPKVVLEALSCGVPVIASGFKVPKIKGLFELQDLTTPSLANLIMEVLNSKVEVDSAFVSYTYSWDERAKKVDEVYKSLI